MFDVNNTAFEGPVTYSTFGCDVFKAGPDTPDRLEPDVHIYRHGADKIDLIAPDGRQIRCWTFSDPTSNAPLSLPAPTIRVQEGQIVHTTLTSSTGPHTIHHHGIEPTTANDGVGHVSFEVNDTYTYQWQPRNPGTFFYHCHRNTPLHFELGMVGALIVDPPDQGDGVKRLYADGPAYDVEKVWLIDDMDPRWHEIQDHDAGLCGMDVGLNRFEPKYFLLSGVFSDNAKTDPRSRIVAKVGERILIRLINASYSLVRFNLSCEAEIMACDGHNWGRSTWCPTTRTLKAGTPLFLATAQRYDLIVTLPKKGTWRAEFLYYDWVKGTIQDNGKGRLITWIHAQ